MQLCSILDMPEIMDIARDARQLRDMLISGTLVYVNEDKTALAYYTRVNVNLYEAHVDSLKQCRGYALKSFLIESGKDAMSKDERITSVINFVDANNKRLLLFSGTFAKRVGRVGDRIMFVTEKERYL